MLPDPDGDFNITTDASEDEAFVGAVLTQNGHPIAFFNQRNSMYINKITLYIIRKCLLSYMQLESGDHSSLENHSKYTQSIDH
jgi:hypothetical protein